MLHSYESKLYAYDICTLPASLPVAFYGQKGGRSNGNRDKGFGNFRPNNLANQIHFTSKNRGFHNCDQASYPNQMINQLG